jgi:hypothetical protein
VTRFSIGDEVVIRNTDLHGTVVAIDAWCGSFYVVHFGPVRACCTEDALEPVDDWLLDFRRRMFDPDDQAPTNLIYLPERR